MGVSILGGFEGFITFHSIMKVGVSGLEGQECELSGSLNLQK